jgi:hypothetical protein
LLVFTCHPHHADLFGGHCIALEPGGRGAMSTQTPGNPTP